MSFLIDESADVRVATHFRSLGHDVTVVAQDDAQALPDRDVLAIAAREQRIRITFDRDFGELVFSHAQQHAGVLYFRIPESLSQRPHRATLADDRAVPELRR